MCIVVLSCEDITLYDIIEWWDLYTILLVGITTAVAAVVSEWGYVHYVTIAVTLRQDQSGQSGLSCAVSVVLHILEPSQSEYACSFVGRLVITLIKQVSFILIIAHRYH